MKRVEFVLAGVLVLVSLVFLPFIQSAEMDTGLEVKNSSPYVFVEIPYISFAGGEYESDLDLDDYFWDPEGDSLTYTANTTTPLVNASVSSLGIVSFSAAPGFNSSFDYVTFTASDGYYEGESDAVRMYVGDDLISPYYTNVSMDKQIVYQNDFVTFSSYWHDDRSMKNFDFYFLQEGIENSSWIKFTRGLSGKDVWASIEKQITVPLGSYVKWRFCGNDTSDNRNCTEENEFYVFERPPRGSTSPTGEAVSGGSDSDGSGGSGGDGGSGDGSDGEGDASSGSDAETGFIEEVLEGGILESKDNFSLSADSFSIDLKQGSSTTKVFEIINNGKNSLDFNLQVEGLEEMVFLSETNFSVGPGKSKKITVDFRAGISLEPGEYYGKLIVNGINQVEVPIAIFINFADIMYNVNVSVLEDIVKPGRNVSADIGIKSLRDITSHEVSVEFAIKDFYGNIYFSEEEDMQINKILEFEKSFIIPDDFMVGNYIFYARVSSEKDYALGSDDFKVGTSYRFDYYLKYSFMFIVIFLLSFVFVFLYWKYKAKKRREKALDLYVKFQELKNYMQKEEYSKAADMYISIKRIYGEKVSKDVLNDKEKLAKKIEELAKKIDFSKAKTEKGDKKDSKEEGGEEKNSEEEKKEEDKENVEGGEEEKSEGKKEEGSEDEN